MIHEPFKNNIQAFTNSKQFIKENNELIKDCLHYFIKLIKDNFKDFKFNDNSYVQIDTRPKKAFVHHLHQDGDDEFIIFIYPKNNPIATAICSYEKCQQYYKEKFDDIKFNKLNLENFEEAKCPEDMKVLPIIKQCDAIMIKNASVYHCTPKVSTKRLDYEKENMSFIRFSLKKRCI